jgi:glucokinase
MRVLAGDIGGTKTAVAIAEIGARSLRVARSQTYPSAEFDSLESVLEEFLRTERHYPAVAGFGVAGPVREGRSKVTKLPWTIDERRVSRSTGIPRVRLLNDFVANALGVSYLSPRQTVVLARGDREKGGPVGILGAGTGLGQAAVITVGVSTLVMASEGGHADFGPRTETEDRLVSWVRRRFGRTTRDRLLSGEGLTLLYDFLKEEGAAPESPDVVAAFAGDDRAAVISRLALDGGDRLCQEALKLFVSIYGSEAGNLALQYRATGGVYVAGGIAAKILPALQEPEFLRSFRNKPPMEELLARIPVHVVREPRLGLYGAAAAAYRTAMETTRPSFKTRTRPRRR